MIDEIERVLISENKIDYAIQKVADKINSDFSGKEVILVCIMKGSLVFTADLARKLTCDVNIDFMQVSSYGAGSASSGKILIKHDLEIDIANKNVIVVEDIVDSGNTLFKLKEMLLARKPASLKLCSLLDKPDRREVAVDVDYVGMQIPDEFVVGFGLDYNQKFRNLPYIGVLKRSVYEK